MCLFVPGHVWPFSQCYHMVHCIYQCWISVDDQREHFEKTWEAASLQRFIDVCNFMTLLFCSTSIVAGLSVKTVKAIIAS